MTNYMIFPNNTMVQLLARNGVWKFKINGKNWSMYSSVEQLMAYYVLFRYKYNIAKVSGLLQANYKRLDPMTIEMLISYFKKTHPIEEFEYSLENIPIYATENLPLYIANPFSYDAPITISQEKELLELIKSANDPKKALQWWFSRYVDRYALSPRYKRDIDIQYQELAISFCEQHGIDYWKLMTKEEKAYQNMSKKEKLKHDVKENFVKNDLPVLKRIGWFMVGFTISLLASEYLEFGFLQGILLLIGLAIMSWAAKPIYKALFGKRKQ